MKSLYSNDFETSLPFYSWGSLISRQTSQYFVRTWQRHWTVDEDDEPEEWIGPMLVKITTAIHTTMHPLVSIPVSKLDPLTLSEHVQFHTNCGFHEFRARFANFGNRESSIEHWQVPSKWSFQWCFTSHQFHQFQCPRSHHQGNWKGMLPSLRTMIRWFYQILVCRATAITTAKCLSKEMPGHLRISILVQND